MKLIMIQGKPSPYRDNEVVVRLDNDWPYRDYDKLDVYDKLTSDSEDSGQQIKMLQFIMRESKGNIILSQNPRY